MSKSTESLADKLKRLSNYDVALCYQCGKCSAGCPMSAEMPLKTHQIMRLSQKGDIQRLSEDPSIWLCLTCEICTTRCPQKAGPSKIIDALRELALIDNPSAAPKRLGAFHKAFLNQIKSNGRLYEVGLVVEYKLRSGALMDDVFEAPGMLAKGKLSLTPTKIKGIEEIKRIFEKCEEHK